MRKHLSKVRERVREKSSEGDLWWKEQQVENREVETNSPSLSNSEKGSVPAGEGASTGLPGGEIGGVLRTHIMWGLGFGIILGCLGIPLSHYSQKLFS